MSKPSFDLIDYGEQKTLVDMTERNIIRELKRQDRIEFVRKSGNTFIIALLVLFGLCILMWLAVGSLMLLRVIRT